MGITEDLLFEHGFEKKYSQLGPFYVKGKVGIAQNVKWLPCNIDSGEPINTCSYIGNVAKY